VIVAQFTDPAAAVADSISSLDKDVVNEVRSLEPPDCLAISEKIRSLGSPPT
jgi:hypothetical protein